MTCRILPYSAGVVKLTNYDFPCLARKIAIGSLSTSALAALKGLTYDQFRTPFGKQPRRHLGGDFLCVFPLCFMVLPPVYFLLYFTVLLKQLQRLQTGGFIFQVPPVSDYITWCTNAYLRVRCTSLLFTRLVHQPPAYALVHQPLVYKALTNQGGGASVYRPRSLLQYERQSPSKRAYNTTRISCPWIRLTRAIKLVRTIL